MRPAVDLLLICKMIFKSANQDRYIAIDFAQIFEGHLAISCEMLEFSFLIESKVIL